jgi:hypothetical protein
MRTIKPQWIVLVVVLGMGAYGFVAEPRKRPAKEEQAVAKPAAPAAAQRGGRGGGPTRGGKIKVIGTGFDSSCVVRFDGVNQATDFGSTTELYVSPPAHAAGPANVTVVRGGEETGPLTYTYKEDLTITSLDDNEGSTSGGDGPY